MNPEVLPEEYGGTGPKISHVIGITILKYFFFKLNQKQSYKL